MYILNYILAYIQHNGDVSFKIKDLVLDLSGSGYSPVSSTEFA